MNWRETSILGFPLNGLEHLQRRIDIAEKENEVEKPRDWATFLQRPSPEDKKIIDNQIKCDLCGHYNYRNENREMEDGKQVCSKHFDL